MRTQQTPRSRRPWATTPRAIARAYRDIYEALTEAESAEDRSDILECIEADAVDDTALRAAYILWRDSTPLQASALRAAAKGISTDPRDWAPFRRAAEAA